MIFGSLFSGIEAASAAWEPLGWRCAWVAEIDPFASAVLRHRYPQVPNLGDVNEIEPGAIEPVDLVVFGSPCQSFSVAGKRLGLDDPRGNMALVGLRVVGAIRPRWMVWENVPGVLSSDGGRDFGAFLGLLGELGYGFAYRVLDAQHFGVPQRRRRVFVVGYLGDWRPAAAVLFEPESLRGGPAPRREAGERVARPVASCSPGGSGYRHDADTADSLIAHAVRGKHNLSHREDTDTLIAFSAKDHGGDCGETAPTLRAGAHNRSHANADVMPAVAYGGNNTAGPIEVATACNAHGGPHGRLDFETETFIAHPLRADGFDAGEDGTGRGTPLIPINLQIATRHKALGRGTGFGLGEDGEAAFTIGANHGHGIGHGMSVRRLTPRECERLQGLPDDYTLIPYRGKPAADGPRYRAIGNSMAVPVMRWIGERIQAFEDVPAMSEAAE